MAIDLRPGTIIDDRYELTRCLGEGGMGAVYLAREIGLERQVAVKLLHADLLTASDSSARFERESKVLAALHHENVVSMFRFGIWNQQNPYLVMEYLNGQTLRKHSLDHALSCADILEIVMQVCAALQAAHDLGIIHRDLKPDNVMVLSGAPVKIKILDFGLSIFSQAHSQHLTQTGELVGTIFYMSPEQCLGRRADHRSDIYSLGCIVYELLSGAPPFSCDNPIGIMHKHSQEQPPPLASTLNLPAGLEAVVLRALRKDPEKRYQSMAEFASDLALVGSGQGHALVPDTGPGRRRFNSNAVIYAVLSLGLIACGTLAFFKLQSSSVLVEKQPQRISLHAKALVSQFSLIQSASPEARASLVQGLVKQVEDRDDGTLSAGDLVRLYDDFIKGSSCSESEMVVHIRRFLNMKRLKEEHSAYAAALLLCGRYRRLTGHATDAENTYKQAAKVAGQGGDKETLSDIEWELSDFYLEQGKLKEAESAANLCKECANPDNPFQNVTGFAALAASKAALGKTAESKRAVNDLKKSLLRVPPNADVTSVCSKLCKLLGRYSPSVASQQTDELIEVLKSRGGDDRALADLMILNGEYLLTAGRYKESTRCFRDAAATQANSTSEEATRLRTFCSFNQGLCALHMKDRQQARAFFLSAMTPSNSFDRMSCLMYLCVVEAEDRRMKEFYQYLTALDQLDSPGDEQMFKRYLVLAEHLLRCKLPQEAAVIMEHLAKRKGANVESPWQRAGLILAAVFQGNTAKANAELMQLEHSAELSDELRGILCRYYARELIDAGNMKAAAELYRNMLRQLSPAASNANFFRLELACLYIYHLKDYEAGRPLLETIIKTTDDRLLKLQATQALGNLLVDQSKPDEALRVFSTVRIPDSGGDLRFAPTYYQLLSGMAKAYELKHDSVRRKIYHARAVQVGKRGGVAVHE